jgi:uncharacterized coiled-coil DUF342 family protein
MNTSTMSTAEETKTIKEIANLEQCVTKAVKLAEIKPKINELFQKRQSFYDDLKHFKTEVALMETEIEALRKQMEDINTIKTDKNQQIDAVSDKINKVQEEISNGFSKKDELREQYFKNRYDYEIQRAEINHINWIKDQKERIIAREAEKVQLAE